MNGTVYVHGDVWALVASFTYVFSIVGAAEWIRRRLSWGVDFTRKVVHVGVGLWILPTLWLFEDWRWAIVPPLTFILLNVLSYRHSLVGAMEDRSANNLGTILFPVAFAGVIAWLWPAGRFDVIAGSILVLAIGDAAAALVGRRFGRHRYRIGRTHRSVEGSAAMLAGSLIALLLANALFHGDVPFPRLLAVAAVATFVEATSRWGFDNLLVPLVTAASLLVVSP